MKTKTLFIAAALALNLASARAQNSPTQTFSGRVAETMNAAGYTYVLVDDGHKQTWAATMQFAVKVGDAVSFTAGEPMANFRSKSLNREFPTIYFVDAVKLQGANGTETKSALPANHPPLSTTPQLPPGHPAIDGPATATSEPVFKNVSKATGGKTIAQIIGQASALAGKTVVVRGQVVKYNAQILGKNWLHIRDGSGSAEKNNHDLTVTTSTDAKLGDTVLVTGQVTLNKDFGAGYKYAILLDDAQVKVE